MKKEMSSFDVRSVVNEMAVLKDAHMDKIFQWGNNVLLRINVQGQGKKDVFFKDKRWLYLPERKPETPVTPQSFATFLRKYLDNARIGEIYQAGFDRVVIMEVLKADRDYKLIFEMFGGGNVLLVLDGEIMNCLIHKTMRDRSVRPGEDYIMPKRRFDPTSSPFEEFMEIMRSSTSDAVRTLATGINLGGQYAEETCEVAGIPKNTRVDELSDDDLKRLFESMSSVVEKMMRGDGSILYRSGDDIIDISPMEMSIYSNYTAQRFDTTSKAIDAFITETEKAEAEEYVDPEIVKLQKRISKQTETVEQYKEESDDLKLKADAIYANYQQITELLAVPSEQSKKLTWEKLKKGTLKIPFVPEIDPSKNRVVAEFDNIRIPLDYTEGIDSNASIIYQQSKDINEKAKRAKDALDVSLDELAKKEAGLAKTKAAMANKVQPTKQFWFERYKWFIAPSGRLVIAGKDAHTNDNIVKKHLKEDDLYAHADLHGAPSTIIKKGKDAPEEDLREACIYALAQSKGWVAALTDGSAYWVYTDQVSKTPQAGEFVPRGAFIIRGKRNYEYHLPMELAVGEITYENSRKVMCAPLESMKRLSNKYFVIHPGRGKAGKTAALMAKELMVPEEEVSRILPPGDAEIVRKVWPEESQNDEL
ncbi:MAG: NFACT family protein [Candidatus Methanomethylophilaceae archaeon]|nr:NFACT family protein [Candidatus Methanomethylophilaceae archaeon]